MTAKHSTWLLLASMSLAGCGDEPSCPAGSTKQAGVCVMGDPAQTDDDDGDDSGDGDLPDAGGGEDDGDDGASADAGCPAGTLVYVDMDGDGVGAGAAIEGCPADGLAPVDGDCSPENMLVFPGAQELCNGIDDDCDEAMDEDVTVTLYVDTDGDGHGDKLDLGESVCAGQAIPGKVASHDDCDDDCAACSPDNAAEAACDGKDENCDGNVDEGVTTDHVLDCDGDGYLPLEPQHHGVCSREAPRPDDCGSGKWFLPGEEHQATDCSDLSRFAYPGSTQSGTYPVAGTEGYDYNCDGMDDATGVGCPFSAPGADCTAQQFASGAECFRMIPTDAQCGQELPAVKCVENIGLHPYVWRAITKRSPCQ